jgi:Fe-S-cluster-containing dehydrogenase component
VIGKLFTIDTGRCIGCHACSVSCKDRAGLPDNYDLLRVERVEFGSFPKVEMFYRVSHCFHCESPACFEACRFDAISKNEDGYVILDENKCTGCGLCVDACPFEAIIKIPSKKVMKCDGCYDEVAIGLDPTCVRACLTRALSFKEVNKLSDLERIDRDFNSFGIGPAVIYLIKRNYSKNFTNSRN